MLDLIENFLTNLYSPLAILLCIPQEDFLVDSLKQQSQTLILADIFSCPETNVIAGLQFTETAIRGDPSLQSSTQGTNMTAAAGRNCINPQQFLQETCTRRW